MSGAADGAPEGARRRICIVIALEGVLLDLRPAVLSVVNLLSGATPADLAAFEATGEFATPWEIARAVGPWIAARRPRPIPPGGWRVVVNQCGRDPGELSGRAIRLWEQRGWREEAPRVDAARLARLATLARLAVVSDRDRAWLARAQERLGHVFEAATTIEDAARPDPAALLRLAPNGHFVGTGPADRACAEAAKFAFHDASAGLSPVIDRFLARLEGGDQGRSTVTSTVTTGTSTNATTQV